MAKSRGTSLSPLDRSPSHLLHRVLQLALDIYAEEAGAAAISQRQYAVLCAVAAEEGVSQTGLVRITGIDRSTMADMMARMIAKGFLIRERSAADARLNIVRTTEKGRAVLQRLAPKVASADQRMLELLGPKKREPFVAALRRLAKAGDIARPPDEIEPKKGEASGEPEAPKRPKPKKTDKPEKKKKKLKPDTVVNGAATP